MITASVCLDRMLQCLLIQNQIIYWKLKITWNKFMLSYQIHIFIKFIEIMSQYAFISLLSMFIYLCIHLYIYLCIHLYIYLCRHLYIYLCINLNIYLSVHINLYTSTSYFSRLIEISIPIFEYLADYGNKGGFNLRFMHANIVLL